MQKLTNRVKFEDGDDVVDPLHQESDQGNSPSSSAGRSHHANPSLPERLSTLRSIKCGDIKQEIEEQCLEKRISEEAAESMATSSVPAPSQRIDGPRNRDKKKRILVKVVFPPGKLGIQLTKNLMICKILSHCQISDRILVGDKLIKINQTRVDTSNLNNVMAKMDTSQPQICFLSRRRSDVASSQSTKVSNSTTLSITSEIEDPDCLIVPPPAKSETTPSNYRKNEELKDNRAKTVVGGDGRQTENIFASRRSPSPTYELSERNEGAFKLYPQTCSEWEQKQFNYHPASYSPRNENENNLHRRQHQPTEERFQYRPSRADMHQNWRFSLYQQQQQNQPRVRHGYRQPCYSYPKSFQKHQGQKQPYSHPSLHRRGMPEHHCRSHIPSQSYQWRRQEHRQEVELHREQLVDDQHYHQFVDWSRAAPRPASATNPCGGAVPNRDTTTIRTATTINTTTTTISSSRPTMHKHLNSNHSYKSDWTHEEDAIIYDTVTNSPRQPFVDWVYLARNFLPHRKSKAIRARWVNQLNPAIIHSPFTDDEDRTLYEAQKQCGNSFVEIAHKFFNGRRSENQVKNRFHSVAFGRFLMQKNLENH